MNVAGLIGGVQTDGVPPGGQSNTTFTFSHMTFTVQPGLIGPTGNLFLRPGMDGIVTTDAQFVIPPLGPATIQLLPGIPEPETIALLALGLGVIAFAGSRRPLRNRSSSRPPLSH